jgi:glycosyltransferase involved in cell wall biosynthesis
VFRNDVYYNLKPFIPLPVRRRVRRWVAARTRALSHDLWPILPGSQQVPKGWSGWPGGKKFALVLTHDVESKTGLENCRQLMALERNLGFRSSFNFIPEGGYRVGRDLLRELSGEGFEVGVHDLYHDGKLYQSRKRFLRNAARINGHLQKWGAVGFRSGFMLNNLDWLHELNIEYDASTFDTDPFEPQPQGCDTIFPFWVPRPGASSQSSQGFVELPYTLPQDSTLFLILQEATPEIWFRKLDWVARQGGMALINTHPDYMAMSGVDRPDRFYPVAFYRQLLDYVRDRYAGDCWHATPVEVARWYKASLAPAQSSTPPLQVAVRPQVQPRSVPRKVSMVAYSHYETDNRVLRYAEELARRGDAVEVFALKSDRNQADAEMLNGVKVHRVQSRLGKNQESKVSFLLPILRFWLNTSVRLSWKQLQRRCDVVHVHNVPDFLVFTAWLPKLLGAKVILDIHDIVPEFYSSKFKISQESLGVRLLKRMERASARFANHVIISNDLWREKYAARTGTEGKCSVFINNVDGRVFQPRPRTRNDGKTIILFPGGLQWHQGLDIAIRALPEVLRRLPQTEFHIYGSGNIKPELVALAAQLGLVEKVRFFQPLPIHQIVEVMANADLGVVPKRADSFGNEAYSTKIMEFMSLGIPLVVSRTKIDTYYFNDSVVRFFESGNSEALAEGILEVLENQDLRHRLVHQSHQYVERHGWAGRKDDYLGLVDSLCESSVAPV